MTSKHPGESSFTLFETIMALGILVTVILEVSNVQGGAIRFSDYSRKSTKALWIASAVMAEIEYKSTIYPLKEIKVDPTYRDRSVSEDLCSKDPMYDCDYTYSINIEEFELPITELLTGGLGGGGDSSKDDTGESKDEDPFSGLIKDKVKEILGDDVLKVVTVEVFWPEGANRGSVQISTLLTNQKGLDDFIETLSPLDDKNECKPGFKRSGGKCVKDDSTNSPLSTPPGGEGEAIQSPLGTGSPSVNEGTANPIGEPE